MMIIILLPLYHIDIVLIPKNKRMIRMMKSSEMGHISIKAASRARTNPINNVNASNAVTNANISSLTQQFPPENIKMLNTFLKII